MFETAFVVVSSALFVASAELGAVRIHPAEPAESPTLSTGHKVGQHRIQGISDEFIPAIVDLSQLDPVIPISEVKELIIHDRAHAHGSHAEVH